MAAESDMWMSDEAIMRQEEELLKEQESKPMVGLPEKTISLLEEFASASDLQKNKIKQLAAKYPEIRRVRRDGNCFFRAYGFAMHEWLLNSKDEALKQRIVKNCQDSIKILEKVGFDMLTTSDFHDMLMDEIELTVTGVKQEDALFMDFNSPSVSNWIICYLRFLTSGWIQADAQKFLPFIGDGDPSFDLQKYCQSTIEGMNKESEQVHILALAEAVGLPVRVEYLDQSEGDLNHHDMPDDALTPVALYLLYRPGHYEILYPATQ
mmetsp:Transcript_6626/g.20170  ORF Transcript_6626/g.20170 Transcript_6626/m.20170 type:complete len:265 (+) Transcript_6626:166-960(+)